MQAVYDQHCVSSMSLYPTSVRSGVELEALTLRSFLVKLNIIVMDHCFCSFINPESINVKSIYI